MIMSWGHRVERVDIHFSWTLLLPLFFSKMKNFLLFAYFLSPWWHFNVLTYVDIYEVSRRGFWSINKWGQQRGAFDWNLFSTSAGLFCCSVVFRESVSTSLSLTFVFPCIVSVITTDDQQDATALFYLLLISSTCFGRCFRPSSGAYHRNYSCWYCPPMLLLAGVALCNTGGQL